MDGDEVAGFSINGISLEENARRGRSEGWVEELAVRLPVAQARRGDGARHAPPLHAFKAEG